jgi:GTP-binding protein HflX
MIVFNKTDKLLSGGEVLARNLEESFHARYPGCVTMSALRPGDVARLRQTLVEFFAKDLVEDTLTVPYDRQQLRGEIFAACQVVEEKYDEQAVVFTVKAHPEAIARIKKSL